MADVPNYLATGKCRIFQVIIDIKGFRHKHGLDIEKLIQLCGGIPDARITAATAWIESTSEDTVDISVDTDFYQVVRTIDFSERIIINNYMKSKQKGNHTGTNLFLNQVKQARLMGFELLITLAKAPIKLDRGIPYHQLTKEEIEEWDGYYRWARVGYLMYLLKHTQRLDNLLHTHHRTEKKLGELVLKKVGYTFWKEKGFTWNGVFDLKDGEESMEHLREYMKIVSVTNYIP